MRYLVKAYDVLLHAMAGLAGLLLAAMMFTIFIDVVLRNLGYQSSAHLFTFTEYALLLVPCLGAPWLVREKGHVYVEIMLMYLNANQRRIATWVIGAVCIAVCLILAWYGFEVTWRNFTLNDKDVRSFDAPRWMIVIFIPLSFLMMAVEFLRYLLRGESFLAPMAPMAPEAPVTPVTPASVDVPGQPKVHE
ncbi:MAG: TRAP transporter small permease [Betaproteobacteria bacterium]|nr:TRAP transporter small permease [Betaproteobacteria bacterium]